MRYLDLAETLRLRIADGVSGALPSEAALGAEFGVSRVTVRRALELLRGEGLVHSRRGAGWFVAMDPIRQPLGRITTLEGALEAAGAAPSRRVLEFAFEAAPSDVAKTLGLSADDRDAPRDAAEPRRRRALRTRDRVGSSRCSART